MIIYGKQVFLYTLKNKPALIEEVFLSKELDKKLFSQIASLGKKIIKLDNQKAQAMANGGNHQGFFARIKDFEFTELKEVKKKDFIVVLCGITDVGNIGSIIRSSYAMGVDAVVIADIKNLKMEGIVRSSAGCALDMQIAQGSSKDLANELKQIGFTLYGADMDGQNCSKIQFAQKTALFIGSEGEGIDKKTKERLDKIISIKMERNFDSLNVSVATAILIDRIRDGRS